MWNASESSWSSCENTSCRLLSVCWLSKQTLVSQLHIRSNMGEYVERIHIVVTFLFEQYLTCAMMWSTRWNKRGKNRNNSSLESDTSYLLNLWLKRFSMFRARNISAISKQAAEHEKVADWKGGLPWLNVGNEERGVICCVCYITHEWGLSTLARFTEGALWPQETKKGHSYLLCST